MEKFRSKIAEIKEEAFHLNSLRFSEDLLFENLNGISKERLLLLAEKYKNSEGKPVNSMRQEIIRLRLKGENIGKNELDQMIEKGNDLAQKNSFKAWGYFSILFPIIHNEPSFDVKQTIADFGQEIITKLNLSDVVAKPFVVGFGGPRNFGSDNVWMAIYNKSNPKQTTAVQLFFQIDYRGLICHLYDRLKDHFISSRKIEDSDDMQKQVFNFFKAVKDKVILDSNEDEEVRFRELGVKTNSIFKISHGTKFFPTLEEIQYCIDQDIVVVHEDTGPKGRGDTSQYENFVQAKPGDLFYLCWGNSRFLLIGQFIDDKVEDYKFTNDPGWKKRKYRFLFDAISDTSFAGSRKWWTPNDPSTCIRILEGEYKLANDLIFKKYFKVELKSSFDTELLPPKIGAAARQKITIDEIVDPKLEVSLVAKELTGIIDNLNENKGQMIGIFGSWGRGKTFLYDQMQEHIEENKELRYDYEHFTFNAWRYQETETIWAHLYGSLLEGYIGKSNWWGRLWKTFTLNLSRKGVWPLISIVFSFLITIFITYFISFSMKFEVAKFLTKMVGGVIGVVQAILIYRKYYQPFKETLESYVSLQNYNEVLGLQSKIQVELIALIKHWLKDKSTKKIRKRLLLFVDDIDRCQEEKIINVVDALRVMLDNEDLIERIVVLVAVDEVLLDRAIQHKYHNFQFDPSRPYSKNLVEEYMDKLFIAGIKLPKLNQEEQGVILRNYAISNDILERINSDESENESSDQELTDSTEDSSDELIFPDANPKEYIQSQSEYSLLEKEMELLNKYSNELSESVTPRQLRIYMYRYLLAKNIASDYMWQKTGEDQLSDEYCAFLAKAIALRSNNAHNFNIEDGTLEKMVNNLTLRGFSPKLIEMVVPY